MTYRSFHELAPLRLAIRQASQVMVKLQGGWTDLIAGQWVRISKHEANRILSELPKTPQQDLPRMQVIGSVVFLSTSPAAKVQEHG